MRQYRTKSGDTWDKIAYEQLGSEYLLPLLLEVNQQYRYVVQFEAGVLLNIPDVEETDYDNTPDWLRDEEDEETEEVDEGIDEGVDQPWRMEEESI
ncbi:tail protein X [Thermaerobacillus caldiproteolyticus]|uniref:phage tail protein n=1 Tax=Thermaerobacillus caldiproteolyticus TaxID=247480 RepID=UPI00188B383D|nr:phage tail protein [Anoxybacillus caldiproteolyticus]QPA33366.1 phage tail protein [Anoxybacillus caldiproteolyticus]